MDASAFDRVCELCEQKPATATVMLHDGSAVRTSYRCDDCLSLAPQGFGGKRELAPSRTYWPLAAVAITVIVVVALFALITKAFL
jgi:hypothetical protein